MEPMNHKEENQLYPVFLKLEHLKVLLVGAGNVGLEKLESILVNAPETEIYVVAPFVRSEFKAFIIKYPKCKLFERPFQDSDLKEKDLVVLATDNNDLHVHIKNLARAQHVLINVADTPDLCDFYLGSIVRKGNLKIAISTNGKSPTVAKRLKQMLQESLPDQMDELLENIHAYRNTLTGDFKEKVIKLNALTKGLVEDEDNQGQGNAIKWISVVRNVSIAFIFMVIGYFFFSYLPMHKLSSGFKDFYLSLNKNFHWMVIAGFVAQMVDGALGMGYGVASATILLSTGINPATISGSIHTAEMFASAASGISHYRIGNVNMKLFWNLVLPGVLGAIAGAVLLVTLGERYGNLIRPFIAVYTLALGIRFIYNALVKTPSFKKVKQYRLLAAVGGFFDSFAGGGWGPIVTTTLINGGRSHKYVVGTVSLTEFFVTFASAMTFFQLIGISHWQTILALIIGGFIAAPLAARVSGKLNKKTAYFLLGSLVIFWSIRILIKLF